MAWVWGSNGKGELGLGDYVERMAPFPLVSLQEKGINEIQIGSQFSIGFAKPKENVRLQGIPPITKEKKSDQVSGDV